MAAKNQSHGSAGHQSNDTPPNRVGDGSDPAQDDGSTDDDKESPNPPHGHISHGTARFLAAVDVDQLGDDWIDKLPDAYERWQRSGDPEQAELTEWGCVE